jgi:hypothetical protein
VKECIVLDADDHVVPMENGGSSFSNSVNSTGDNAGDKEIVDIRFAQVDQKSSTKLISSLPVGTKQTSLQAYFGCSRIESSFKNRIPVDSTTASSSSAASSSSNRIDTVEEPDCDDGFVPSSKKLPYYKRIAGRTYIYLDKLFRLIFVLSFLSQVGQWTLLDRAVHRLKNTWDRSSVHKLSLSTLSF